MGKVIKLIRKNGHSTNKDKKIIRNFLIEIGDVIIAATDDYADLAQKHPNANDIYKIVVDSSPFSVQVNLYDIEKGYWDNKKARQLYEAIVRSLVGAGYVALIDGDPAKILALD